MQYRKFRRIKKAPRAVEVESHKISNLRVAVGQRCVLVSSTESSVERIETAGRFSLIQAGAGYRINYQTRLVAIFRWSRSSYNFQRLNGIDRNLRREGFALLIRNWLVIQRDIHLGVISEGVHKAV